ncbi:MAG TPA: transcription termination factor NusA [Candidatus Eisenbacteria bacterium]|nr:transcription termination factor NusA [Candidatus Eisenbacteria bacterium]
MNYELMDAMAQIAREKSVDKSILIETLVAGLLQAGKKRFGPEADVDVKFDEQSGKIVMALRRTVVEDADDLGREVDLAEAQSQDPDAKIGQVLVQELSLEDLGRNAIATAKQVLVQRVREAERERIYEDFHDRVGEMVRGTVQQVDRGNIYVKLDRSEAILPPREQIARDRFHQGDHIKAYIIAVDKLARGPQVILSRTHPEFLRRLFESEVPEVAEKIIEIKGIAREPGSRAKVSVVSNDDKIDAVGACVGIKGSRVQAIVRELGGEKIDIVPWSVDPIVFVTRALSPAKVLEAHVVEMEQKILVTVADDQLSLAIGKGGQNARLAAKLTGWKIDLISKSERERQKEYERRSRVDIEEFEAAGPKLREKLLREGIETVQDLLKTPLEELLAIQGVGEKTAEKLLEEARELLARRGEELEAEAARAVDEAEKQKAAEAAAIARLQEMEAADRVEEAEAETVREASMETEVDEQMRGDDSIGENEAVQVGDVETMTIDEGEEDHLRPVEDEAASDEAAADETDQDEDETREERATGAESEGPPPRA